LILNGSDTGLVEKLKLVTSRLVYGVLFDHNTKTHTHIYIYSSRVSSASTRDAEGSVDTTTVDVDTILEEFQTWDYLPKLLKYLYFQSISIWIKGILLYM
jgi:hypothetical protein